MKRRTLTTALGTLVALSSGSGAWALDLGDPAPPLKIKEWVRGDAVNLAKDSARKLHLVEFWATWCPPCKASVPMLTEIQKKHEKDLVIIGVTDPDPYRNPPAEVKSFVKEQGSNMMYTVALDDDGQTTRAYMPDEVVGIPYAFLVGRDGKVVWHGSPLDPAMAEVIPEVIAGKYDVNAAKKAADTEMEVAKRFQTLELAYEMGQTQAVWDGVLDVLRLDPANETAMQVLVSLRGREPSRHEAFRRWARDHITAQKSNVKALTRLARALWESDDVASRVPELALQAARAASEASNQRDVDAVEIYARSLYLIGDLDRAISVQKDVLALVSGDDKEIAQQVLAYYEECRRLQATH